MRAEDAVLPLPAELYAAIISTFRSEQDLVFLWTVLRNVSHLFRDLVDEFVRRRHLPETHLIPNISMLMTKRPVLRAPSLQTLRELGKSLSLLDSPVRNNLSRSQLLTVTSRCSFNTYRSNQPLSPHLAR